jgi:hypothetical protein
MEINEILDDSIRKASEGMSNKIDAHLLTDLKRMSELGVLQIEEEQPEFTPFDEVNRTISVSQKVRLSFKGEETIIRLEEKIKKLEDLAVDLYVAIEYIPKHLEEKYEKTINK